MTNLKRDLFSLITLVGNVMEAYSASLFLENKSRRNFQLTTFHSLSPHIIPDASVVSGQGFLGWVLENNEPLSVNQFDKDTIVLGYYDRNEDIKSFMAAPLLSSRTRGALAIDSKKTWCFTPKCQKILTGFAQQFAYLVDGALAAAHRERRRIDIASLGGYLESLRICESENQLLNAICLVPRDLLPFDGCFLVLADEKKGTASLVRTAGFGELFLGEIPVSGRASVAGYVLGKGESLRLPDLKGQKGRRPLFHPDEPTLDTRSVAAVPLAAGERVLGALGFTNRRRNMFDAGAVKRAELIAGAATSALERLSDLRRRKESKSRDWITGGRNALFLRSRLGEILQDANARGRQIALLAIAPDESDDLSERVSPAQEEALALHLWRTLEPYARDGDILVRHMGTRFFLLLHGTSHEHAEAVAERLIQDLNESPFTGAGREISLTASVGIACFPEDGTGPEGLFSSALSSLQAARSEGANQLCLHGGR